MVDQRALSLVQGRDVHPPPVPLVKRKGLWSVQDGVGDAVPAEVSQLRIICDADLHG